MTPEQFTWYLAGRLDNMHKIGESSLDTIKAELRTVFRDHIDPSYPKEKQQALQNAHQGKQDVYPTTSGTHDKNIKYRC